MVECAALERQYTGNRIRGSNPRLSANQSLRLIKSLWSFAWSSWESSSNFLTLGWIFKPLYIPLLALISGFLLIKSKNSQGFSNYKFKIFTSAVIIISLSEISTKFYSASIFESFLIIMVPFTLFFLCYLFFKNKIKMRTVWYLKLIRYI